VQGFYLASQANHAPPQLTKVVLFCARDVSHYVPSPGRKTGEHSHQPRAAGSVFCESFLSFEGHHPFLGPQDRYHSCEILGHSRLGAWRELSLPLEGSHVVMAQPDRGGYC